MKKQWMYKVILALAAIVCMAWAPIGAHKALAFSGVETYMQGQTYKGSFTAPAGDGKVTVTDGVNEVTVTIEDAKLTYFPKSLEVKSSKPINVVLRGQSTARGGLDFQILDASDSSDYDKDVVVTGENGGEIRSEYLFHAACRDLIIKSGRINMDVYRASPNLGSIISEGGLILGENGKKTGPEIYVDTTDFSGIAAQSLKMYSGYVDVTAVHCGMHLNGDYFRPGHVFQMSGGTMKLSGKAAIELNKYEKNTNDAFRLTDGIEVYSPIGEEIKVQSSSVFGASSAYYRRAYSYVPVSESTLLHDENQSWSNNTYKTNGVSDLIFGKRTASVTFTFPAAMHLPQNPLEYQRSDSYGLFPTPASGESNLVVEGWRNEKTGNMVYEWQEVTSDTTLSAIAVDKTPSKKFVDVKSSDWYNKAAYYCFSRGLITGVGDGSRFAPSTMISRGMIVTILYRLEGSPSVAGIKDRFPDVAGSAWFHDAVLWADANGIVTGYDNGTFGPGKNATREQVAAILKRYANYRGIFTTDDCMMLIGFADSEKVSSFAGEAMSWAAGTGIITGKEKNGRMNLQPQGSASRAEFATMLMRYCMRSEDATCFYLNDNLNVTVPMTWFNNVVCHRGSDQYGEYLEFANKALAESKLGGTVMRLRLMSQYTNFSALFGDAFTIGMVWNDSTPVGYVVADFSKNQYAVPEGDYRAEQYNRMVRDIEKSPIDKNLLKFDSRWLNFSFGVG